MYFSEAVCTTDSVSVNRPLHIAARNGLVTVVQLLIDKGSNLFALDCNG